MSPSRLIAGLVLTLSVACASTAASPAGDTMARGDSKTVTEAELTSAIHLNLYDFVAAERPRWLRTSRGLPLVIFMDDSRLGDATTLKSLTTGSVRMLRYFEASAAQQKFAGRDIGTVIQVVTK